MKHEPRPAIDMEKQLGWGGVSGDLQGGANSVSQFDGVSYMAPAAGSVALWFYWGWVQKRDNGLPLCVGEDCSPALTLMTDTSLSLCMPLVPFKLLS